MEADEPNLDPAQTGVFRSLLVAYDGSEDAQRALRFAEALALDVGAGIHVLQVLRPPAHAETLEELEAAARAELHNLSLGLDAGEGRSAWSGHVVVGNRPAQVIARFAEDHGVDVVILGGHGREQATHGGIGRSLEALLRHRPCPILVV